MRPPRTGAILCALLPFFALGCSDDATQPLAPASTHEPTSASSPGGGVFNLSSTDPLEVDLIAGKDEDVGSVTVTNDAAYVYVTFTLGTGSDYCLGTVHAHAASTVEGIPQKNGNPIPGQFAGAEPWSGSGCTTEATVQLANSSNPGDDLYVAAHAELYTPLSVCSEPVWQLGDVETLHDGMWLTNPADEFNYPDATPTTFGKSLAEEEPPFTTPFVIGTTPTGEWPWNSNYARGYATDLEIEWSGPLPFGGLLTISWSPGASATETKVVGDGVTTTTFSRTGFTDTSPAGFLGRWPRFEDEVAVSPLGGKDHTLRFQHTAGNGTAWDWVRLERPCEESAWAADATPDGFPGNSWATYFGPYTVSLVVGSWDAARGGFASFATAVPFAKARMSLEGEYPVVYRTFGTLSSSALAGVHVALLGSAFGNSSGASISALTSAEQSVLGAFASGGGCAVLMTDGTSFNAGNNSLTAPFGLATDAGLSGQRTAALAGSPSFTAETSYETNYPGAYDGTGTGGTLLATLPGGLNAAVRFASGPVFAFSDINAFWTTEGTSIGAAFFEQNETLFLDVIAACF